jgi:hypothetical protein
MKNTLTLRTLIAVALFGVMPLVSAFILPEIVKAQACSMTAYTENCSTAAFTSLNCGTCPFQPPANSDCAQDMTQNCDSYAYKMTITGGSNFCCIDSITIVPQYSNQCWSACVALSGSPASFWTPSPMGCFEGNITFNAGYRLCADSVLELQFCEAAGPMQFTFYLHSGINVTSFTCTPTSPY